MFKTIKSCFTKDAVNNGRQIELDMTKGFAVIFMVWVHVLLYFGNYHENAVAGILNSIWGGPFAAPVFMMSMGAGICYSRKQSAGDLAKRGIRLLTGSIVLNFMRFTIFMFVGNYFGAGYNAADFLDYLLLVDILSFAGLAFIFLALAKKMNWSNAVMLFVSAACSLCGTLLRNVSTGSEMIDAAANFIWGANARSCFPFLNWIAFPVAGMIIGQRLKHCGNKDRFYRLVSPVCLLAATVYLGYAYQTSTRLYSPEAEYYFLDLVDVFFCVLLYIGLLGQNYLLTRVMKRCRFATLRRFSAHLNTIYCIHWVLLMACYTLNNLLGMPGTYSFAYVTLFSAALLAVSDAIAYVYLRKIVPLASCRCAKPPHDVRAYGFRRIRYALLAMLLH